MTVQASTAGFSKPTGIVLYTYPAEPTCDIQVQRTTQAAGTTSIKASTSPADHELIDTLAPQTRTFVDLLPLGSGRRFYRFRHSRGDCTVSSSWGAWVSDEPTEIDRPLPPIPGLDRPVVELEVAQNGSTGEFKLNVTDIDRVADKAEFATKAGATDFGSFSTQWDDATGVFVDDESIERTERVTLAEKHNVAVKGRVRYTDRNNKKRFVTRENTFDIDRIAEVNQLSAAESTDATVITSGRADEDTSDVYFTVGADAAPAVPTTGNFDLKVSSRTWDTKDTGVSTTGHSKMHLWARGLNQDGQLASTDNVAKAIVSLVGQSTAPNAPVVELDVTQSGSTGTYDLSIYDFSKTGLRAEFATKTGAGSYGSFSTGWDTATGTLGASTDLTRLEKISLAEKHNVAIKSKVAYTAVDGTTQFVRRSHTFDVDEIAEVNQLSGAKSTDDTVLTSGRADEDTSDVYFTVGADSAPNAPTTSNFDLKVSSRTWDAQDTGVSTTGHKKMHLWARGKNQSGQLASTDHVAKAVVSVLESTAPNAPVVELDVSQAGSTGTFDLSIHDFDQKALRAKFATKTGAGSFGSFSTGWDTATGTFGVSTDLTRLERITLAEKHNVAVKARVAYEAVDGTTQFVRRTNTFDVDEIAEINSFNVAESTANTVLVSGRADEDTQAVHVKVGADSAPVAPTTSNSDLKITERSFADKDTGVSTTGHVKMHAWARGLNNSSQLASTDHIAKAVLSLVSAASTAPNAPVVELDVTQAGSTGTFALDIHDFDQQALRAKFAKKTGSGSYGSFSTGWDTATGTFGASTDLTRDEKITLQGKHNVGVKARVAYTAVDGTTQFVRRAHTFDVDEIAEVNNFSVAQSTDDTVLVSGRVDEDTQAVHVKVGADGAPVSPTTSNSDLKITERSFADKDTGVSTTGHVKMHAWARGLNNSSQLASTDHIAKAVLPLFFTQDLVATMERTNSASSSVTFDLDVQAGPNVQTPEVQLESMILDGSSSGWSVEQSWVGSLPHSETVLKSSYPEMLRCLSRDAGANNARGAPAFTYIEQDLSKFDLVDVGILDNSRVPLAISSSDGRIKDDATQSMPSVLSANRGVAQINPPSDLLTATDAGGSATITVSNHDMKAGTRSVVTMSSGSITGLNFNSIYRVYLDDDLKDDNNSPSYNATLLLNEDVVLNARDRYYVGTVQTPSSGAADNTSGGDRTLA